MKRAFLIAAIAAMPFLATSAHAQSQNVNDTVVASVDGTNIYASDIVPLYQGLPDRYRQVPMAQIADQLLERLIDQTVLANAARKAGLDKSSTIARRIKMLTDGVLQQAYIEANIGTYLSDEMLKEEYRKRVAELRTDEEIRARHILLKTEDEAKKVIAELQKGADFAEAAKKHSTGPSGVKGGDLGFFSKGMMVPEFQNAAFAMKDGEISTSPVKTQFGWHIIKVEERRKSEPPSFDQMAAELRRDMNQKAYQSIIDEQRKKAKIEMTAPAAGAPATK